MITEIPMTTLPLAAQHCQPRKGKEHALDEAAVAALMTMVPGWKLNEKGNALVKDYRFENFHHTLGFINAVGFMANHEDHHPDIEAGYGHCKLHWSTHDVGGLSLNDFICAARVDALLVR
jgi:4a-hydroxytetrahydrobiopterin dehydratase